MKPRRLQSATISSRLGPSGVPLMGTEPYLLRSSRPSGRDATASSAAPSAGSLIRPMMLIRTMPIYEYKCDNGHTFEAMQSMSEEPLDACDVCGAPARRVLHPPAVHFKGSGFYTTDYARKGAAAKPANGSDSSKSDSKDAKGSDSKSDSGSSSGSGEQAASKKD